MAELVRYYSGGWWVKNVFMNRAHTKTKIINNNTNQISMNDPNSRSGSFFVWPNLWLDVQAWLSRYDDMAIFCLGVSVFGHNGPDEQSYLAFHESSWRSGTICREGRSAQVADQATSKWNQEQRKQTWDETMALGYMRNSQKRAWSWAGASWERWSQYKALVQIMGLMVGRGSSWEWRKGCVPFLGATMLRTSTWLAAGTYCVAGSIVCCGWDIKGS